MSTRQAGSGSRPGGAEESMLRGLVDAVRGLAGRMTRAEVTIAGQTAPADCRFEREIDADDNLWLVVVRVSTGNRQRIAGPL